MESKQADTSQNVELLTRKVASGTATQDKNSRGEFRRFAAHVSADFLRCSVSYIDNCAKDLPRIRYGRKVLFSKSTLQKWLLAHEDKPNELN